MQLTSLTPLLSLPAGSTTGNGAVLDNASVKVNHAMYVLIAGTNTAGVVTLETSVDNVNWTTVAAQGGSAATAAGFSTGTGLWVVTLTCPAQFVRAGVTTTITGSTVTAWVASA